MPKRRTLLALAAAGAATAVAAAFAERRLLRALEGIESPTGWLPPRFPQGAEIMVPTDDGAQICTTIAGPEDGPVAVLVHGLTSNHHDWGPVARLLVERGWRVVGVNQRGHGGSTVGSDGFGAARLGADLGQVIRALDLRDVVLCGHSMGGVAAMSLLTLRPETGADRVGALVLVATLAHTGRPDRRATLRIGNTTPYERLAAHDLHSVALARFVFGKTPSREMVDAALASNKRCPRETREGAALGLLGYDIRPHLAQISVPAVVVVGDRDYLTPLSENRRIADGIGCDLVVVEGAGHLLIWEHPEVVADAVASLARHSSDSRR